MEAVRAHFRPELLNRIDEIVIFKPLGMEQIAAIVDLELTDAARELLAREGYDPVYGARPLKRAIQKAVVQPLAMRLLQAEFRNGDTILVDADGDAITFRRSEAPTVGRDEQAASVGA